MKLIFAIALLWTFIAPFTQDNDAVKWIETEATIVEVHNKIKAKSTRAFAMVSFTANDGKEYQTQVEIFAIPLYGTIKSVGDQVSILYHPEKPLLAKTPAASFIEKNGLYLFLLAGVVFSFYRLRKGYAKQTKE